MSESKDSNIRADRATSLEGTRRAAKAAPRDEGTREINRELRKINARMAELKEMLNSGREERKALAARKSELVTAAGRTKS